MILTYTSSNGQTFNLKASTFRTRRANFHDFSWSPKAIDQQYGARVTRFERSPFVYAALISVFGTLSERKEQLNILHAAFDSDIRNMTPGKITHGDYCIDCYIVSSSTFYENPYTQNEIDIYCPYPFWYKVHSYSMHPATAETYDYLDYPYGFLYDFQATLPGHSVIENPGAGGAEWELTVYGYAEEPFVVIGNQKIGVYATVGSDERLVINSKNKTVIKYGAGEENLFNQRYKEQSIFNTIPPGEHSVIWSGHFSFDLKVNEERSEPLWT